MAEDLPITDHIRVPGQELKITTCRSSGPGGQHVNTTDSRVRLQFNLAQTRSLPEGLKQRLLQVLSSRLTKEGVLSITSDRYRSQQRNLEDARQRFVSLILQHLHPPKVRRATKPSRGAQRRRIEQKKRRSDVKRGRRKPRHDD